MTFELAAGIFLGMFTCVVASGVFFYWREFTKLRRQVRDAAERLDAFRGDLHAVNEMATETQRNLNSDRRDFSRSVERMRDEMTALTQSVDTHSKVMSDLGEMLAELPSQDLPTAVYEVTRRVRKHYESS